MTSQTPYVNRNDLISKIECLHAENPDFVNASILKFNLDYSGRLEDLNDVNIFPDVQLVCLSAVCLTYQTLTNLLIQKPNAEKR